MSIALQADTSTTGKILLNGTGVISFDSTGITAGGGNPVGTVIHVISSTPPTGYLKANGFYIGNAASGANGLADTANAFSLFSLIWALSATDYPMIDSVSGGGGAKTRTTAAADFSFGYRLPLPDLRGEFLRGFDDGKGTDSGRRLASSQTDAMQGHVHQYTTYAQTNAGADARINAANTAATATGSVSGPTTDGTNGTPRTAAETRPRNWALLACIKY
jgi:hypothetical protein